MTDDEIREAMRFLKERFLRWRTPPVELPADSVIEEVVREIYRRGMNSRPDQLT